MHVFQQGVTGVSEADVVIALVPARSGDAAVRTKESTQEGRLNLGWRGEDSGGHALLVCPRSRNAESAEEHAYRFAPCPELNRPVAHLLAGDPADQLA